MKDIDISTRIFDFNLTQKVGKLWDEEVPVINHLILEGVDIDPKDLDGKRLIDKLMSFCKEGGFHVVRTFKHGFVPQGISVVFVLEESHIAVHTWPERKYMHMDIVTCSKEGISAPELAEWFKKLFNAKSTRAIKLKY